MDVTQTTPGRWTGCSSLRAVVLRPDRELVFRVESASMSELSRLPSSSNSLNQRAGKRRGDGPAMCTSTDHQKHADKSSETTWEPSDTSRPPTDISISRFAAMSSVGRFIAIAPTKRPARR
jgi:hypothetical protein